MQPEKQSWAEPWKVKVVEPLRRHARERPASSANRRRPATTPFCSLGRRLYRPLTDSGTSAMSDWQWAGMMLGDEAYAGSKNFYHLEEAIRQYYGYRYLVPTHQGRGAENILSRILIKPGDYVPGNMYFTTTRLHQELAGGHVRRYYHSRSPRSVERTSVQGRRRPRRARKPYQKVGADKIPYVCLAATVNMAGGQPISMENMRGARLGPETRHPHHPRRHPGGRERLFHPAARSGL